MGHYLLYFFIAAFGTYLFKFIFGLLFGIPAVLILSIDNYFNKEKAEFGVRHPKIWFLMGIMNHTLVGLSYSYLLFVLTISYMQSYNGNYWLYVVTSIIFTFGIQEKSFPIIMFITSTINIALLWIGLGYYSPIFLGALSIIIGYSYYLGRINMYQQIEKP